MRLRDLVKQEVDRLSDDDLDEAYRLIVNLRSQHTQKPRSILSEAEKQLRRERFESHFGEIQGDPTGANNEDIDTDLAREYASNHEESS